MICEHVWSKFPRLWIGLVQIAVSIKISSMQLLYHMVSMVTTTMIQLVYVKCKSVEHIPEGDTTRMTTIF